MLTECLADISLPDNACTQVSSFVDNFSLVIKVFFKAIFFLILNYLTLKKKPTNLKKS